jgi:hypothetical protein
MSFACLAWFDVVGAWYLLNSCVAIDGRIVVLKIVHCRKEFEG